MYRAVASGIWLLAPFKQVSKSMCDFLFCLLFLILLDSWLFRLADFPPPLPRRPLLILYYEEFFAGEELPDEEIGLSLIPGYVVKVFKLQFLDLAGSC